MCQHVPNHLQMCGVNAQTVCQHVSNGLLCDVILQTVCASMYPITYKICGVDLQTVCQLVPNHLQDVQCRPTDCVLDCTQSLTRCVVYTYRLCTSLCPMAFKLCE